MWRQNAALSNPRGVGRSGLPDAPCPSSPLHPPTKRRREEFRAAAPVRVSGASSHRPPTPPLVQRDGGEGLPCLHRGVQLNKCHQAPVIHYSQELSPWVSPNAHFLVPMFTETKLATPQPGQEPRAGCPTQKDQTSGNPGREVHTSSRPPEGDIARLEREPLAVHEEKWCACVVNAWVMSSGRITIAQDDSQMRRTRFTNAQDDLQMRRTRFTNAQDDLQMRRTRFTNTQDKIQKCTGRFTNAQD